MFVSVETYLNKYPWPLAYGVKEIGLHSRLCRVPHLLILTFDTKGLTVGWEKVAVNCSTG
jgi:hypothetical protein